MSNYHREYGDDLLSTDTRLKYKWKWDRIVSGILLMEVRKWTHFQVSYCEVEGWELEAVQWFTGDVVNYEARIIFAGDTIASKRGFKTRLDAQIGAEKLLRNWISKQYAKHVAC